MSFKWDEEVVGSDIEYALDDDISSFLTQASFSKWVGQSGQGSATLTSTDIHMEKQL